MSQFVTILFSTKVKKEQKKVEKDLLWYDPIFMKMKTFKGGYLKFEYGMDEDLVKEGYPYPYRMMPKVADLYESVNKNVTNKEDVIKWYSDYINYNDSEVAIVSQVSNGIDFNVPDNELDSFLYECERNNFRTVV
jgi:hypothetical protein